MHDLFKIKKQYRIIDFWDWIDIISERYGMNPLDVLELPIPTFLILRETIIRQNKKRR